MTAAGQAIKSLFLAEFVSAFFLSIKLSIKYFFRPKVTAVADRMGLEGIVSKRATSRYVSGTSRNWLKTKCFAESELILIGTEIGRTASPWRCWRGMPRASSRSLAAR